jgi:hypothetical protein
MWASVQTVRGCPKHCSFFSVWRTDGQEPRQRHVDRVVHEIVELRRLGFRFIALADDNFYPVSFEDLAQARRRGDPSRLIELQALRDERLELMTQLARLPDDLGLRGSRAASEATSVASTARANGQLNGSGLSELPRTPSWLRSAKYSKRRSLRVDKADRSAAIVPKALRIACRLASG